MTNGIYGYMGKRELQLKQRDHLNEGETAEISRKEKTQKTFSNMINSIPNNQHDFLTVSEQERERNN